jgi:hypothetical protein
MQNTSMLLKSLEDDVAELQSLVKDLDCQEEALKKAVTRLGAVQAMPQTEFANQGN